MSVNKICCFNLEISGSDSILLKKVSRSNLSSLRISLKDWNEFAFRVMQGKFRVRNVLYEKQGVNSKYNVCAFKTRTNFIELRVKSDPKGGAFFLSREEWNEFIKSIKSGGLNLAE